MPHVNAWPAVGTVAYRIVPTGSQPVLVNRYLAGRVSVCTPDGRQKWSPVPIMIEVADLFVTRDEARAEFRKRRKEVTPCETPDLLALPVDEVPDGDGWRIDGGNTFYNVWVRP